MKTKITFPVLMFAMVFQWLNAQTVITVDNTPGSNAQYSDLQIAIASAQSGDILNIQPSEVSYGNIIVDKPLSLIGYGHSGEKETLIRDINFGEAASNCRFSGLHVTGSFRVQLNDESVTLTNMIIENSIFDGNMAFLNGGVDNMILRGNIFWRLGSVSNEYTNTIISNNIITDFISVKNHQSTTIKNNLFLTDNSFPIRNAADDTGTITVQNNIIYRTSSNNVNANSSGVVFENCMLYNSGSGNALPLEGSNNLVNLDPLLVETNENNNFEADLDDFHLQPDSPAVGAGVQGEDIGLYGGGTFVFNNFGFTKDVPTVRIESVTNTVAPGENINLVISTNTH